MTAKRVEGVPVAHPANQPEGGGSTPTSTLQSARIGHVDRDAVDWMIQAQVKEVSDGKVRKTNKACAACGVAFYGFGRSRWCADCRAGLERSGEVEVFPFREPLPDGMSFADRRCLRCEEPFAGVGNERFCKGCRA